MAIRFQNFSLLSQPVKKTTAKPVVQSINHIIAIDVSGSMSQDLPGLRQQLKNKLVDLVKDGDTVSIVWFSGRNEFGTLLENVEIRTLKDLSTVHQAIDRYLRPVGLTGFKQPLEEVGAIISRIAKKSNNGFSLFFMTDGYDNQWSQNEILKAAKALEDNLVNATFVEYGWYCNRALISKMAESIGGNHIFSENLQDYQISFEKELGKRSGGKKIEVSLKTPSKFDFAFGIDAGGSLLSFEIVSNKVKVPENLETLWYFTRTIEGDSDISLETLPGIYAGITALSQRMMANEIFEILGTLGDVKLINKFVNCFSKQDYSDFQALSLLMAVDEAERFPDGMDASLVPAEDAYTVLDVLNDLAEGDDNLLYPFHKEFLYERIGAERVDAAEVVTDSELEDLKKKLLETKKVEDLKVITDQIAALQEKKVKLTFEHNDKTRGFEISGIVFNEDRPNVSIRFRYDGKVKLPENKFEKLPESIDTYIYRNYTIVRDGIVHTRKLPVSLNRETFDRFQANGLLQGETYKKGAVYVVDLSNTPVINRQMVKSVKGMDLFNKVWEMTKLKAEQKVFNTAFKDRFEKTSQGFAFFYGEEAAAWLKEIGVTDYNGFNPKSVAGKNPDVYQATFLEVAVKGLSSLPSVKDVQAKLDKNADLTVSQWVMKPAMDRLAAFLNSKAYLGSADQNALLKTWLETERKAITQKVRQYMVEIAKIKFAVVVGHTWFSDFAGLDDVSRDLDIGYSKKVTFTAKLETKELGGNDE